MRIAFITYLYPNVITGGGANYAFNLVNEISKHEDISVFIPNLNIRVLRIRGKSSVDSPKFKSWMVVVAEVLL